MTETPCDPSESQTSIGEFDECGECGEGLAPDGLPDEIADGILTTNSVNSTVYNEKDGSDPEGHISLMDLDGTTEKQAVEKVENMPGITVVLESSPGSHHAWNLTVGDIQKITCRLVMMRDDAPHIRSGLVRGHWRLRVGPKLRENGDTYKSPPELVTVVMSKTDSEQSMPHWNLARAMFDLPALPKRDVFNWTGASFSVEKYVTLTDEAKEEWTSRD